MDDWDNYRLILALHRSGSLRSAARLLGVNHSTVSRRLATLQAGSAGILFEQVAGGYRPTETGAKMVSAAEDMEEIAQRAERQQRAAGSADKGPITLSLPEAIGQFLLFEDIGEFGKLYPDIDLTIISSYGFANLDRSEADMVIRGTDKPSDHLVGRRLFPYALSHYCKRGYLDDTPPEKRRWLATAHNWSQDEWKKTSPFSDAPILYAMSDLTMRHKALLAGQGMARTACYMADTEPDLMRLPGAKTVTGQHLWVLTHPDLKDTPRIKTLMRYLCDALIAKRTLIEGKTR
ncbi:LysR family transcriptional regulator [Sphingorhabdus sp. Alg239-R122]|uniref:LysR family transcriptional regulator n=1 Tax=Sphingorhabdus sp. Alg239-R122 TaxID=2305989 RepID=UPI0013D97234|nr:LysR family transcriptional regulator [Sphingorhabdus sp. Alg239-R122]